MYKCEKHILDGMEFCSLHSLDHAHLALHRFFFFFFFCSVFFGGVVCFFLLFPILDLNTLIGDSKIHRLRECQSWTIGKSHFVPFPRIQLSTSPSWESHRNILPVSDRPKIWVLGIPPISLQGTQCCQVSGNNPRQSHTSGSGEGAHNHHLPKV